MRPAAKPVAHTKHVQETKSLPVRKGITVADFCTGSRNASQANAWGTASTSTSTNGTRKSENTTGPCPLKFPLLNETKNAKKAKNQQQPTTYARVTSSTGPTAINGWGNTCSNGRVATTTTTNATTTTTTTNNTDADGFELVSGKKNKRRGQNNRKQRPAAPYTPPGVIRLVYEPLADEQPGPHPKGFNLGDFTITVKPKKSTRSKNNNNNTTRTVAEPLRNASQISFSQHVSSKAWGNTSTSTNKNNSEKIQAEDVEGCHTPVMTASTASPLKKPAPGGRMYRKKYGNVGVASR